MEKQPEKCPQLGHWVKSCCHVLCGKFNVPVQWGYSQSLVMCVREIWFPVYNYGQALASLGAL